MSVYQEAYHLPEFTYDKYEKLTIEQRGPVYICSFNDPGNLNAMSYAADGRVQRLPEPRSLWTRIAALSCSPAKASSFCAGFNLNDLVPRSS